MEKDNHIVLFPAKNDHEEEEEEKPRQHMMIKTDLKSAAAMSNTAFMVANANNPVMSLLDIMRESSTLLRLNSSALMWVMFILISPFSALFLSAPSLLKIPPIASLHLSADSLPIYTLASSLHSSFFKSLYFPLSRLILSYSLCSPFFFTTWLLAKAFIIFAVSSTYSSRKPSIKMFTSIAFRLWRRLLCAYLYIACAFVAFFTIATIILSVVVAASAAIQLPDGATFLAEMAIALSGSVLFAHMVIIANLATVVCILEDHIGMSSLMRCVHLIRGRTQVALSLVLTSMLCTATVESLYEHRVIGVTGGSYEISAASRLWEAPLIIIIHSFLYLYHAIMTVVFYFTCKSAALEYHQHTNGDGKHMMSSAVPTSFLGLEP